eukprot:2293732-Amphidinium_carterae.1
MHRLHSDHHHQHHQDSHHHNEAGLRMKIRQVFRRYDRSGDGFLDEHEVRRVLKTLMGDATSDEAFHLCTDLARLKAGKVSCKEFTDWVISGAAGKEVIRAIHRETGEKRDARILQAFQRYDKSGDGLLDVDELRQVLRALGSFTNHEVELVCTDLDTNRDGDVSLEEFKAWINNAQGDGTIVKAKGILAPSDDSGVEGVFYIFCGAERSEMDGKSFVKFCKDCGLIDKKLTETGLDLIFSNTKVNTVQKQHQQDESKHWFARGRSLHSCVCLLKCPGLKRMGERVGEHRMTSH